MMVNKCTKRCCKKMHGRQREDVLSPPCNHELLGQNVSRFSKRLGLPMRHFGQQALQQLPWSKGPVGSYLREF